VNHAPIRLGSILFTVVEPHAGHEVAYNRWYERDHFYSGCLIGPGILAGRRFVATRPYKDLRFPENSPVAPDKLTGSYLALYWIERGMQDEWGTWAAKQVHALHTAGRMFAERDHIHTKMYRYRWGAFRDDDGVPPELALDHPYAGVAAVIGESNDEAGRDALLEQLQTGIVPAATSGAAAMTLAFTPVPIPDEAPADVPRLPDDARRFLLLSFLESDPKESWDAFAALGDAVAATGHGRVLWASPFIPTLPGTDTYTDQLR
jgi:hypothetical protein